MSDGQNLSLTFQTSLLTKLAYITAQPQMTLLMFTSQTFRPE